LLLKEGLPVHVRDTVSFMLSHAFSMPLLLLGAIVVVPFAVPVFLARGDLEREAEIEAKMAAEDRAEYNHLIMLHGRIVFAAHPGLMTLVILEMFLIAGPLVLLSGAVSGKLLPEVNQASILQAIESEAGLLARRRTAAAA
jgi:hypothetical protein